MSFVPWLRFAEDIAFTQMLLAASRRLLKLNHVYFFQGRLKSGGCQAEREEAAAADVTTAAIQLLLESHCPLLRDAAGHAATAPRMTNVERKVVRQLQVWVCAWQHRLRQNPLKTRAELSPLNREVIKSAIEELSGVSQTVLTQYLPAAAAVTPARQARGGGNRARGSIGGGSARGNGGGARIPQAHSLIPESDDDDDSELLPQQQAAAAARPRPAVAAAVAAAADRSGSADMSSEEIDLT